MLRSDRSGMVGCLVGFSAFVSVEFNKVWVVVFFFLSGKRVPGV